MGVGVAEVAAGEESLNAGEEGSVGALAGVVELETDENRTDPDAEETGCNAPGPALSDLLPVGTMRCVAFGVFILGGLADVPLCRHSKRRGAIRRATTK